MKSETVVYVITDNPDARESLRLPLAREGFDIRPYDSSQAFFDAVALPATGCVLIDVDMQSDGLGLLAEMNEHHLAPPVIFVTAHPDYPLAIQAMRAGAIDLLERPFDDEALLAAVRRCLMRCDPDQAHHSEVQAISARLARLTKREKDVLTALLKGRSNKVIAHELGISKKTVEVHRANLMTKMGARTLAELMRMGLTAERRGPR